MRIINRVRITTRLLHRRVPPFICAATTLIAMLLGGTPSPAFGAAPAPGITALGDLPGGTSNTRALRVSDDGLTVVGYSSSTLDIEAFRWTAGSGIVGLGTLGAAGSSANGASADGSVVVGGSNTPSGSNAFRWTAATGMLNLGNFPGSDPRISSAATAVSADGSVVVGTGRAVSGFTLYSNAFRWTAASGLVALGDLPGGALDSNAVDVSADGSVIVGNGSGANASFATGEAFRWTAGSGMVSLGDLAGGAYVSQVHGVSADGSTVVGEGTTASGHEAFRWTAATGMVGLGDLPGGVFESYAWDVSADGSTVVGTANGASEAFRWTSARGMEPLWDVLVAAGIDPAADGWTQLTWATGVSADGNTFIGVGARNGNLEAFVATIPEPGALGLISLALPALLRRRKPLRR